MSTPKVILYYIFTPLSDPSAIKVWQKNLCESLNLKGRIIIAPHGINGTLGGEMDDIKKYIRQTRSYEELWVVKWMILKNTLDKLDPTKVLVR